MFAYQFVILWSEELEIKKLSTQTGQLVFFDPLARFKYTIGLTTKSTR